MKYFAVGLAAGLMVVAFDMGTADAGTNPNISQRIACPQGWSLMAAGVNRSHCRKTPPAMSHTPTCRKHNMANDWKWSSAGHCYRTKNRRGDKTTSTANIQCRSYYSYNRTMRKCAKGGKTMYHPPLLTSLISSQYPRDTGARLATAAAATRTLHCQALYTLVRLPTRQYHCKRSIAGASHTPRCLKHSMRNDWKWSTAGHCYRVKNRKGDRATSTANIGCSPGYSYDRSAKRCTKRATIDYQYARL